MFYTYSQNNSGGFWKGPAKYVIVEADSADEADSLAESQGVYFDSEYEIDCRCCGSRWHSAHSGDEVPSVYGEPVDNDYDVREASFLWRDDGPVVMVFFKDGSTKAYG